MSGNVDLRKKTPFFRAARYVVYSFFQLTYRPKVEGLENVPMYDGIIVASNHLSNLDPPLIGICLPRYIRFMGKIELFRVPVLGPLFRALGAFPIHRGKVDKQAIRTAIDIVRTGGCIVMFPEGHRSKTGELGPFASGVAVIARKSGGYIVPTAICGPYRVFRPLTVRFGEPISVDSVPTDQLMGLVRERIQTLLRESGTIS
ncbi:lysophospholipid acyltransferase family protein [Alicyclobacillus fastidiosus]|uniref:Lysophospholipid acyltransferase family protein n=1 Tax=Alicyclobacillus fastidiosus TaxID=392011 RepID=A0ABV5ACR9_9BACL|nr:lysophospholipid acyltransferase family protein [Alicyclobacillus fastidiosus]WEH11806.1 lysophospholipid acyltransferase family protein [Alicyclobacillus fastidiosus]